MDASPSPLIAELRLALAPLAQPARAPAMRAYMRGQFDFLGIATPARRQGARALLLRLKGSGADILLAHAAALWQLPEREYQYVALDLLTMHWKELGRENLPALLALARQKPWWDSVDAMAGVVGKVLRPRHDGMDQALRHPDLWLRRIAMLHQLGWRGQTDSARLFEYALALCGEREFFIQKAIGWALRDYARHAPEAVQDFLQRQRGRLAPLSLREAAKHLDLPPA